MQGVTLSLRGDAPAYYDNLAYEWVAEAGAFEVLIGAWACPGLKESVNLEYTSSRRGNQDAERPTNVYAGV